MKGFKKLANISKETSKFQENVQNSVNQISSKVIIDGVLLENISMVTGVVSSINHGLGRRLQGYMIVRQRGQAQIWDSQDSNKLANLTLNLNCSANVVIDIWCF